MLFGCGCDGIVDCDGMFLGGCCDDRRLSTSITGSPPIFGSRILKFVSLALGGETGLLAEVGVCQEEERSGAELTD